MGGRPDDGDGRGSDLLFLTATLRKPSHDILPECAASVTVPDVRRGHKTRAVTQPTTQIPGASPAPVAGSCPGLAGDIRDTQHDRRSTPPHARSTGTRG